MTRSTRHVFYFDCKAGCSVMRTSLLPAASLSFYIPFIKSNYEVRPAPLLSTVFPLPLTTTPLQDV